MTGPKRSRGVKAVVSVGKVNPRVSVIVLSYFHVSFVERCLNSLVGQVFKDFEIIYVDNASTDGCFERGLAILERSGIPFHAERMSENLGCSRGLNYGLKKFATGEYLSVLSADDWWDFDNLSRKVGFADEHPGFGMVYGNGYNYDDASKQLSLFYGEAQPQGELLRYLLAAPTINPQGILYRHELVRELGYFDELAKVEDRDLWYRIANVSRVGYVHEPLSFYRVNHAGNVSRNIQFMREGNEYIFRKWEAVYPVEIAAARLRQYRYFAYHMARNEPGFKALWFLARNYRLDWQYNKQVVKCILNMLRNVVRGAV